VATAPQAAAPAPATPAPAPAPAPMAPPTRASVVVDLDAMPSSPPPRGPAQDGSAGRPTPTRINTSQTN